MKSLIWILSFGFLMSAIALSGGLFALVQESLLKRWLKPIVAFAAGSLWGGAMFHMLPNALTNHENPIQIFVGVTLGFTTVFALDQLLEWHHCHKTGSEHIRPLGPLLLAADALHNFMGGLAIGAIFVTDIHAGIAAWIAAAMHEIPQEIGDFGAIVHSGYTRRQALAFNFLSALTFPLGGAIAWALGSSFDIRFLVAMGCGNFIYIAAADLIPEVKRAERLSETFIRFGFFLLGVGLLYAGAVLKGH